MRHLVESHVDDTANFGAESSGGFAELPEEVGAAVEKEYEILPPRAGASPEEAALFDFKQKLAKKCHMTLEAFFRACDTSYTKSVPTADLKARIAALNLDINDGAQSRIIQILDEDYNGEISWSEFTFALETYSCAGEKRH